MAYVLIAVLLAVAALVAVVVRSPRPHPRHEFILEMVARLAPGDVMQMSSARDDRNRLATG